MREIKAATVAGSGMMGPGIAMALALGGVETTILSRSAERAALALETAKGQLTLLEANGIIGAEQSAGALGLLRASADFETSIEGRDLVIESIPEDMAMKREWIGRVERILSPRAYITSNTSGLSITEMSSMARNPERICTTHFWNPPHLVPLVEIVMSPSTAMEMTQDLKALLTHCGKVPVIVKKDRPGQLGNRLQMAMVREAVNIVAEGIADVEDVDLAASMSFGLRLPAYGIFEHADIVGLDLSYRVCNYVSGDLYGKPEAPPLYRELFEAGRTFHDWSKKDKGQVKQRRDGWLLDFLKGPFGKGIRPLS